MKVIAPAKITDANFVSSSVPETDYPAWNSATSYAAGDRAIIAATHKVYQAITPSVNKAPAANPADWVEVGMTNRWRMFDDLVGTQTTASGSIEVVVTPGMATGIALFSVSADSVRVEMTDATDGKVFDETYSLSGDIEEANWYSYFFDDVPTKSSLVVQGLPSYRNASVKVTISGGSAVSVGALVFGRLYRLADAILANTTVGIQDFSRKERDEWGNFTIVERAFADVARWNFIINNSRIDEVKKRLASLRATPAVYIGSEEYASTVIYGFYRDFDVAIAYPEHSEVSIELEGLA